MSFLNSAEARWAVDFPQNGWNTAYATIQTADGGFISVGGAEYFGSLYSVVKLDENLVIQWQKIFRRGAAYWGSDTAYAVLQTDDDGDGDADDSFIVAGQTSYPVWFEPGETDAWVLKLDQTSGEVIWGNTYGGSLDDVLFDIQPTIDGGYVLAGYSDYTYGAGAREKGVWVLKITDNATVQWQKMYSKGSSEQPPEYESASAIIQTADGGYLIAGWEAQTQRQNDDSYSPVEKDVWVIKTDQNGDAQWQKTYGGGEDDIPQGILQTDGGGYIIAATTASFGAGSDDVWIVLLDANGAVVWEKTFGGTGNDRAYAVRETADGNFVVAGTTELLNPGFDDLWVIKLDAAGTIIWQKVYEGSTRVVRASLELIADGSYLVGAWQDQIWDGFRPFILNIGPDGLITPGCGIITDSNVSGADTSAVVSETSAVAYDYNEASTSPSVPSEIGINNAVPNITCNGEFCNSGSDDDGDGLTDCADPECCGTQDCFADAGCNVVTEDLISRDAMIVGAVASGDYTGTVDCAELEIVQVTTGPFTGKGFFQATCNATLDGTDYAAQWQGVVYLRQDEQRVYLKGTVSGDVTAAAEGFLGESMTDNGTFDPLESVWQLSSLGGADVSSIITVQGSVDDETTADYPDTELYLLQGDFTTTDSGHYGDDLRAVVTHLRVVSQDSPYNGEGFSIISYSTALGAGEGWTYDRLTFPGIVDMQGLFGAPLYGIATVTLDESGVPADLAVDIRRVDLELPPMADIQIKTWGPKWVSPGQTVDFMIEYRNVGAEVAEDVVLVSKLPYSTEYVSSTGGGINWWQKHEVFWKLGTLAADESGLVSVKVTFDWGLGAHTFHPNFAVYATSTTDKDHFLQPDYENPIVIQDYLDYQPFEITSSNTIYPDDFDSLFSSDVQFSDLYQFSIDEGFTDRVATSMTTNTGPLTVVLMANSTGVARYIIKTNDQSLLMENTETSISFFTTDGGVLYDFNNFPYTPEYWGTWDNESPLQQSFSFRETQANPCLQYFKICHDNCVIKQIPTWLLEHFSKKINIASDALSCVNCLGSNQDSFDCLKCMALTRNIPFYSQIVDILKCANDCKTDPSKHCCTKDLPVQCYVGEVNNGRIVSWQVWKCECYELTSVARRNCRIIDTCYDECVYGKGCVERKKKCSDTPMQTPIEEDGSFDGLNDLTCPEIIVAHDPNIKYGPEGAVEAEQQLDYIVEYENEGEGIAFGVYFTDILDEDLDASTLVIGPVKDVDNDTVIAPPGYYDPATRTIKWFAGEAGPGDGGYAEVSVQVRDNATRGTEIINYATVYFPSVPEETRTNAVVSWIPLEICDNDIDDDNDTLVDCEDPECFGFSPDCLEEICGDYMDNNGDGFADCADSDCPACPEVDCADELDNDNDTLTDCDDPDCFGSECAEVCDDAQDNDADGSVDCDDTDCVGDSSCMTTTTSVVSTSTTTSTGPSTTSIAATTTTTAAGGGTTTSSTTTAAPDCLDDADCDDGLFCNGAEQCLPGGCEAGALPCSDNQTCDEEGDICVSIQCAADVDCDDGLFCNGAEQCDNATCTAGQNPCDEAAGCSEALGECLERVEVAAHCLQRWVWRPFVRDRRCPWIAVMAEEAHHASAHSSIVLQGPTESADGVELDEQRNPVMLGRLMLIPVCVEKGATAGRWVVTIASEVSDGDAEPFVELIQAGFSLQ